MRIFHADEGMTSLQTGVAIALVVFILFFVAFLLRHEDTNWFQSAFERKVKKLHIIQAMSRDLLASAEAEKSAVMADTDEASQTFAAQSTQAAHNVEKARQELEPLLDSAPQEVQLFHEFSRCWEQLQAIDREVLSLAVQNTNLKALRLSFGPGADALQRLETALTRLIEAGSSSPNAVGITRHVTQAVIGMLHVYALHSPHIAESSATRMDEMEADMKNLETQVADALQSLQELVDESGQPFLDAARAAYKDFQTTHAEIVTLSRQNSNVRSFALSLGQKRKTTAQCQDVLAALEDIVKQSMAFRATR
jgi:hypothetical protein